MVETQIVNLKRLPVKEDVGFPQNIYVIIDNITYRFTMGFNMIDESLMMTIRRETDSVNVYRGRVCESTNIKVRSPDTWEPLFGLFAKAISRDEVIIWIIDNETKETNTDLEAFLSG